VPVSWNEAGTVRTIACAVETWTFFPPAGVLVAATFSEEQDASRIGTANKEYFVN
jgi:hypothetical protein